MKSFYLPDLLSPGKIVEIDPNIYKLLTKKQLNSTETAQLCFSVFENENIYREFLTLLPKNLQILIEKMLWVESMTDTEAEELLNEPITTRSKYSTYEKVLKNEFYFFSVIIQNFYFTKPNNIILSLHPVFKQVLLEFYPKPAHYYFIQLEQIPRSAYHFTAETSILQEMPRLLSYYMQDAIKYTGKGRPSEATLNKLQRTCRLAEFLPEQQEILGKTRQMLMAGLMFSVKINNINIDTISLIKNLFTNHYTKLYTSQFILMQLKGWTYMDFHNYNEYAEHNFLEILKQLPPQTWVSAENLLDFIQYRFIPINPVERWALSERLYTERVVKVAYGSYVEKNAVSQNEKTLVLWPFIKGTIFLFASFGLVEITYDDVDTTEFGKTFYSAYDRLQHFRITALGAYVMGLSDSYKPEGEQQQNKLSFSDDSLMILAEGEMSVLDVMLASYAEKCGTNRYKVTHAHFLKDCKTKKDIDKKIALFKSTIAEQLPPYWEGHFKIWQQNALQIRVDSKVVAFKIPPGAKELQKLIAQDVVLKTLILKAEQFYILVPVNHVSQFKSRMKELSYLVEQ